MKLKHLKMYDTRDVPEHLVEEMIKLAKEMLASMQSIVERSDPNVALGALNFLHAAVLNELISDDEEEQTKGALFAAKALIGNVEMLTGIKIFPRKEPSE